MVREKFLSKKMNKSITFSTSERNIDLFDRTLNFLQNQIKEDSRIKNKSRFFNYLITMFCDFIDKGKTLEDFENLQNAPDKDVVDFFANITFTANIKHIETCIELHKYVLVKISGYILNYIDFLDQFKPFTDRTIKFITNRFKKFMIDKSITEEFKMEILGDKYQLIYIGKNERIHFEFTKGIAGLMGFVGLQLQDYIYYTNYAKLIFKKTTLLEKNELLEKDRRNLFNYNQEKFVNYHLLVNDKAIHTWINLLQKGDAIFSFKDYQSGNVIIQQIIEQLRLSSKELFKKDLLIFFKNLGWISLINNGEDLLFDINLNDNHVIERKILENSLNKWLDYSIKSNKYIVT